MQPFIQNWPSPILRRHSIFLPLNADLVSMELYTRIQVPGLQTLHERGKEEHPYARRLLTEHTTTTQTSRRQVKDQLVVCKLSVKIPVCLAWRDLYKRLSPLSKPQPRLKCRAETSSNSGHGSCKRGPVKSTIEKLLEQAVGNPTIHDDIFRQFGCGQCPDFS